MDINELQNESIISLNKKIKEQYEKLKNLLNEVRKKEVPPEVSYHINPLIDKVNNLSSFDKRLSLILHNTQKEIIKILEKETQIVPRNFYTKKWTPLGMAVFGIPIGAALSGASGNSGLLGAGLAVGLAVGAGRGKKLDKKAKEENRVLDFDY